MSRCFLPLTWGWARLVIIFKRWGYTKEHWRNASPIRTIFREAFENAGLPYFNPHSFRNTLVELGEKVLTTFSSYGEVSWHRQIEIIGNLGKLQV